ncbi:MAG: hypothetical protein JO064_08655 [Actinobacteria bacterium]|nr:hypothetical protein [Actinomycetota bacterium]
MTDYLRLAVATLLVLAPGRLVAHALGQRSSSATLAWGTAAIFVAWTVVFVVHGTIWLAVGVLAAIGVVAAVAGARRPRVFGRRPAAQGLVLLGGIVLGILLWHVAGVVGGDGLFHLARVRKLVDLGDLHLRTVDEFKDGGLHPGYAFPLWHGFDALVAKISGLDPYVVIDHEAALLAPLACLVAFEAGLAVFGTAGAGLATLAGSLGLYLFAQGHGGSFATLPLPATAAKQLFVPAGVALFFGYAETRRRATLAALAVTFGALALVHATYAMFALLPLAAYAIVRLREWRTSAAALAAAIVPTGLVLLWIKPLVDETLTHNPTGSNLAAQLQHYALDLQIWSVHRFRVQPALIGRSGAVAVAALALVPLAAFAARRRWSAYVLAGAVSLLALELVPTLYVHFSKLFSLSQSRRAAGFIPFAFAFAGGLSLLARTWLVVPGALAAGIVLQHEWPGDFVYGLRHGGPPAVTWWAFGGGVAALVAMPFFRKRVVREWPGRAALAAALFVVPVAVHGFRDWTPFYPVDEFALPPAVAAAVKKLPPRAVVIASPRASYRIAADAPVYVVDAPPVHVANTRANRPYVRVQDVTRWLRTNDPAIPRKYGATWAYRGGRLYRLNR